MNRRRRKGFSLILLLAWLPLIAAAAILAHDLLTRTIQFQGQEARQINTATVANDLVRRFQEDVWPAVNAQRHDGPEGEGLTLTLPGQAIVHYVAYEQRVVRTEEAPDESPRSREWHLPHGAARFQIEQVGPSEKVAWITLVRELPAHVGPGWPRSASAAARLGRGGDG